MNKTITSLSKTYRQMRKQNDGPAMTASVKILCSNQQFQKFQWLKDNKCIYLKHPIVSLQLSMIAALQMKTHHCTYIINTCFQNCHGRGKEGGTWAQSSLCQSTHNSSAKSTTWPHHLQEGETMQSSPMLRRNKYYWIGEMTATMTYRIEVMEGH